MFYDVLYHFGGNPGSPNKENPNPHMAVLLKVTRSSWSVVELPEILLQNSLYLNEIVSDFETVSSSLVKLCKILLYLAYLDNVYEVLQ